MTQTQTVYQTYQPSIQDITAPHPRCLEMAEAMRDIAAVAGGVTHEQLLNAGFASYEIDLFAVEASEIANKRTQEHDDQPDDYLAEMIQKAREGIPNKPPLPSNVYFDDALKENWGKYCSARAACMLYQWRPLHSRALTELFGYLFLLPLLPETRACIVRAVENTFRQQKAV